MAKIRLASYNIRMETNEDKHDLWRDRKKYVIQIVKDYDFDIIGFQEVKESQLEDLKSLSEYDSFGIGRSNDETNEYNSIFYKRDKFKLLDSGTFWLSETLKLEDKSLRWDADCPRICTWGHFQVKNNDKEFYVFNTHFDHKSENARYQSAKLLINHFNQLNPDTPIFLLGDLNGEKKKNDFIKC